MKTLRQQGSGDLNYSFLFSSLFFSFLLVFFFNHNQIEIPSFTEVISRAGTHSLMLRQQGGSDLNYSLGVSYFNRVPESSENCGVHIEKLAIRNRKVSSFVLSIFFSFTGFVFLSFRFITLRFLI
jgi:hypothetical protein